MISQRQRWLRVQAPRLHLATALWVFAASLAWGGPLTQEAYVWQRAWGKPLQDALQDHGSSFDRLLVLKAEVSWTGVTPKAVRVPVDFAALAATKRPIGLALRVGPYTGTFQTDGPALAFLTDLARSILAEAEAKQVKPCELQIDFDCPETKLAGYRVWVNRLRQQIPGVPITITTLPAWLKQPGFTPLVTACDSYVLQVHSLEKPSRIDAPMTLCDPAAAQRWVAQASKLGVPFRVALPTYGYLVAFDETGRFVGLSAEGPAKSWPPGVRIRELRADPLPMAALVQNWSSNPPPNLQGILWYRFPTSEDILNWRWPTLRAIVGLRSPHESVRAESRRVEPGLMEISLVNDGELDISSRLAVEVRWSRGTGTRLMAADGLRGFEVEDGGPSSLQFKTQSQPGRLWAGEKRVIGWLRLSEDREVQVEFKKVE